LSSLLLALVSRPRLAAAGVGVLILAMFGLQTVRLSHAKADLQIARAAVLDPVTGRTWRSEAIGAHRSLALCVNQRRELVRALQLQNTAIERLRVDAGLRQTRVSHAVRAARTTGATERAAAGRVLATPPGLDACRSADDLILGTLQPQESTR
jgi:hypothetical protein